MGRATFTALSFHLAVALTKRVNLTDCIINAFHQSKIYSFVNATGGCKVVCAQRLYISELMKIVSDGHIRHCLCDLLLRQGQRQDLPTTLWNLFVWIFGELPCVEVYCSNVSGVDCFEADCKLSCNQVCHLYPTGRDIDKNRCYQHISRLHRCEIP